MQKDGENSQKGKGDLLREALNHYAAKRYEETLAACEQILLLDNKHLRAHYGKGLALMGLGRYEEAVTSLDRTLQLTTGFYVSCSHQARVYAEEGRALCALKQYDQALNAYHRATNLAPNDPTIQAEMEEAQRLAVEKKAKDDAGWLCKEPFRYE